MGHCSGLAATHLAVMLPKMFIPAILRQNVSKYLSISSSGSRARPARSGMRARAATALPALLIALVAMASAPGGLAGGGVGAVETDAAKSALALGDAGACGAGAAEGTVLLVARGSDGRRAAAGGDSVRATLTSEGGGGAAAVRAAVAVEDRCDGTFRLRLPCAALPPGRYSLRVVLLARLRRATLNESQWYCARDAASFDGWDELSEAALRALYECDGGLVGGAPLRFEVRPPRPPRPAVGSAACAAGLFGAGTPASHAVMPPVLQPCGAAPSAAEPGADAEQRAALLLGEGGFEHCVGAASGCRAASYLRPRDAAACLGPKRVALVGDSVTEGMYLDVLHMFSGMQRGDRLRHNSTPAELTSTSERFCYLKGGTWKPRSGHEVPKKRTIAPGGPTFSLHLIHEPFRNGLKNVLSSGGWRTFEAVLRSHDVVVVESHRHDLAPLKKGDKGRVLGLYRARVQEFAGRIARVVQSMPAATRPRVVWRTAHVKPVTEMPCPRYVGSVEAVIDIAAEVGAAAFRAQGFAVVPIHRISLSLDDEAWWHSAFSRELGGDVTDIHMHERWCLSSDDVGDARRYGWVSKVLTQLTLGEMSAACARALYAPQ